MTGFLVQIFSETTRQILLKLTQNIGMGVLSLMTKYGVPHSPGKSRGGKKRKKFFCVFLNNSQVAIHETCTYIVY